MCEHAFHPRLTKPQHQLAVEIVSSHLARIAEEIEGWDMPERARRLLLRERDEVRQLRDALRDAPVEGVPF